MWEVMNLQQTLFRKKNLLHHKMNLVWMNHKEMEKKKGLNGNVNSAFVISGSPPKRWKGPQ
jgi:hypothetical protein